jgi:aspartate/methionine/tyrosine aminotransferase
MRFDIAKDGSGLVYEIRQIVIVANKLKEYGIEVTWENIGDPINKGEKIPEWMKEVLIEILRNDLSYGYCPTKGVDETREFLADRVNKMGHVQITPEDIIFFNGLGDAIARAYSAIRVDARIIMPEPTYSAPCLIPTQYIPDESL